MQVESREFTVWKHSATAAYIPVPKGNELYAELGKRWSREDHAVFGCKYKDEIEDLKLLLYKIGEAEAATVSQKQLVELLQEWLKKREGEDG